MNRLNQLKKIYFLLWLALFVVGCNSDTTTGKALDKTKDSLKIKTQGKTDSIQRDYISRIRVVVLGDINGDGKADTAYIYPPKYISPSDPMKGCLHDSCYCRIHFSCNLPDLYPVIGTGEIMARIADLDNNGFSELAFIPEWPTSVWQALSVYGYRNGKWNLFGQGGINLENLDKDDHFFDHRVKRINDKHFQIISDSLGSESGVLLQTTKTFLIK
jgi:hypothetical protein